MAYKRTNINKIPTREEFIEASERYGALNAYNNCQKFNIRKLENSSEFSKKL